MKILKNTIGNVVVKCAKFFCKICPKSEKIWVFGAWQGKLFADNSKYLFEYVSKEHSEIKAVWLTGNRKIVKELRAKGYRAFKSFSLGGIWYVARAGLVFETEGEWDIAPYFSYEQTQVFQLWHGMGVKAMHWKNKDGKISMISQQEKDRFNSYYWLSTSELYSKTIGELLQVDPSRFIITGYPRNDTAVTKPYNQHMLSLKKANPDSKFIIYMPTHRNFGKDDYLVHNFQELQQVDQMLRSHNIFMVYKPHFHELKNLVSIENSFTNIILAKEENLWNDAYLYLHYFDALISDYSSITTDFMCIGKPVILFAFDLENYKTGDAGLNDFFWRIPGGPICFTWDETIRETISLLEHDSWKEEREKARIEYHQYNDGQNCERVYQAAKNVFKKN